MTSLENGAVPPRVSDAERERALEVLREGVTHGRVSQDTFLRRMELVMSARFPGELHAVLHDLPQPERRPGALVRAVGKVAALRQRMRSAWTVEQLPPLLLPEPGPHPLSIGRAPGSVLRLSHHSVSRFHAQLSSTGGGWMLRDLGSANGTWVNGGRVTGAVRVRPGDHVQFGGVAFRLAAR
ncbi:DUF1707 and FHA domain-containing protein [Streptomyces sodiiphilus]|uniref:DUF1707 and FHA domain-containing protein n=1 Tax=Streptomyces sodiiphilus TaxID=226217 RepID=A0ABP5AES7_9ACTN